MRAVFALVLVLLSAPVAAAEESRPDDLVQPKVAAHTAQPGGPSAGSMILTQVKIPEIRISHADAVASQEMPQRGSFWWLVGVIVVAGIVLALLLD